MLRPVELMSPDRLGTPFRWLLASTWAACLGEGLSIAAGPLLIVSLSRDPLLVSAGAVMQWVPGLVLGLPAGAVADRVDRRRLVLVADAVRAAVLVGLTATIVLHVVGVAVVLGALLALGTADTFGVSASNAMIPMLVAPRDLGAANTRMTFGFVSLQQLAGPPLGAALFTVGAGWAFGGQTMCAVAGVLLLLRVVAPRQERVVARGQRIRHDVREGLRWTRRSRPVRALVIQILTFNVTYGASWSVLVLLAQQRLHLGPVGFGVLTTVGAVGGLLGSASYGAVERRVRLATVMRAGLVLETVTHLLLATTTRPVVAMGVLFLFGVHESFWGTIAATVRQRAVPAELQGRVASIYFTAMLGGLAVGGVLGGLLARAGGITAPYWFGFVGCSVILVGIWRELGNIAHEDALVTAAADG